MDERVEQIDAVFGGGGEVGTQMAEVFRAGRVRMPPEIFCRNLTLRTSRSAALLSNGKRRPSGPAPHHRQLHTPVSNTEEITARGGSLRALLELGQVVGDRVTVAGQDVDALGQTVTLSFESRHRLECDAFEGDRIAR